VVGQNSILWLPKDMGFIFSRGVPERIKEQEEVNAHEVFSTMASRASVLFEAMHSKGDGYVVKVFDEMWDASKTIVVGFDKSLHSDWDGHYWASWLPCAASGVKLHMQHARQRLSALAAKLGWQYNELGSWEANKVNYMVAVNKVIF
jgi:hypothetical protein